MKKLILLKKFKIYLLLFLAFSINSIGQNEVNENHMIIKFDQNSTFTFSASSVGCSFVQNINCINAELWCVPDEMQIGADTYVGEEAIADYFASMGGIVEYAEPDWIVEAIATPNDPSFSQLWGMNKINAPQAWNTQTGNSNIVVGVIDSGVDWTHPDLIDNIWQNMGEDADGDGSVLEWNGSQWIFDPGDEDGIDNDGNGFTDDFIGWDFHNNDNDPYDICGHGTHVAGTIGAKGNNNEGVSGVCWDVQMIALKFLELNPAINRCTGSISNALLCLEYAVMNGAPISNNSWGGGPYSQAFADALQVAAQNDHLFVAAAGNYASNNDVTPYYPAAYSNPNVLTVASTTSSDGRSGFSNFGLTTVDLGAPGSGIYSTTPNNSYTNYNGTSMACPHVAGAAALLLSECNSLNYQEIKDALMNSTTPISALSGKCVSGGRLNVNAAMQSLASISCTPNINCLTNDSLALVALYNSTDGTNWNNTWDLSQPVSTWYGIELTVDGCNVECIDMDGDNDCSTGSSSGGNNLYGNIPLEIGSLSKLIRLNLRNNQLTGNIPVELGNLTDLVFLDFINNQLTGNIPIELGNLINLGSLKLTNNQLTGNIPVELGNLTNLGSLDLTNNQLTGNIPATLGNLTIIVHLFLSYNQLSGYIPNELGNLAALNNLKLSSNQLEGCYPQSLCNLSLPYYDFRFNPSLPDGGSDQGFEDFCDGNTPCNTGCLTPDSLALVALYNATDGPNWTNTWNLSQPVNTWYGIELTTDGCNVECIDMDGDNDCSTGSSSSGGNNLYGNIPLEIGSLSKLIRLNLRNNQLTGNIPVELGNLTNLVFLDFINNQLTGNIPIELGNLINLGSLKLTNNQLTGNIPVELGNLTNLGSLDLTNNQLTGNIPATLGNLTIIVHLFLSYNQLSGYIPNELGNLAALNNLKLSSNQLEGCYPQSLCNLSLPYYDFRFNPSLPDGGSDQGFEDFCDGTAPLCDDDCNAYELDLGPDVSLSCGGSVTLSTDLENMALTLWDYEGTLIGNTADITANAPGTYVAVVADSCGNTGIDTIIVNQVGGCVWPGDMNNDKIVNNYDVLFWGLDNGKTGPARSGGNFDWEGQSCTNWSGSGPNGVNDKFSNASGNGTVGVYDLNAITQHYGKVHGSNVPLSGDYIDSFIAASDVNMTNTAGANNGEIVVDLVLSETLSSVHGLVFSIDLGFNGAIKDISFAHNSNWMGSNLKVFYHRKPGYNKIDIAITKKNGPMVSGGGLLGHLLITEDAVVPWDDPDYNISINIDEAAKIDDQGNLTYLSNNSNGLVAVAGGSCPTFHLHNYNNYVDGYYQAENQITSSATIEPTAVVDYRAGSGFTINPAFNIKAGGEFKATIEACSAFREASLKVIDNEFIELNLLEDQVLSVSLFDSNNEMVEPIFEEQSMQKGVYQYPVNVGELASGTYYILLKSENKIHESVKINLK